MHRQEPFDNVRNLEAQDARVSHPRPLSSSTGTADPSRQAFDSKKVVLGIFLSDRHEKRAVAAAQIDFERSNPSVDRSKIQRLKTIPRNELRRRCWIC
jgi:hypothetical protein